MMLKKEFKWLVTGCAGFIGSNLVKTLLEAQQTVVGLDDLSTGKRSNFAAVEAKVGQQIWQRFSFLEGDVADPVLVRQAVQGCDFILHQAALCSVPQSVEDPLLAHTSNVDGFVVLAKAAVDAKVKRLVYASSSAVYGDCKVLPAVETKIGRPLSPYALTKYIDECYADVFGRCYGLESIGLRYFNVFGPMQAPDSAYAAVIPAWIDALLQDQPLTINGNGSHTRDFCFVDNVVQANLLAATTENPQALNQVYNIALGEQTSLLELADLLKKLIKTQRPEAVVAKPIFGPERVGDVHFSQADISRAQTLLDYQPKCSVIEGLNTTIAWYLEQAAVVSQQ